MYFKNFKDLAQLLKKSDEISKQERESEEDMDKTNTEGPEQFKKETIKIYET